MFFFSETADCSLQREKTIQNCLYTTEKMYVRMYVCMCAKTKKKKN